MKSGNRGAETLEGVVGRQCRVLNGIPIPGSSLEFSVCLNSSYPGSSQRGKAVQKAVSAFPCVITQPHLLEAEVRGTT